MSTEYSFAEKITATVKKYKKVDGSSEKCAVRDILTDLMHYCAKNNIDFNERLLGATDVFNQEIDDDL